MSLPPLLRHLLVCRLWTTVCIAAVRAGLWVVPEGETVYPRFDCFSGRRGDGWDRSGRRGSLRRLRLAGEAVRFLWAPVYCECRMRAAEGRARRWSAGSALAPALATTAFVLALTAVFVRYSERAREHQAPPAHVLTLCDRAEPAPCYWLDLEEDGTVRWRPAVALMVGEARP